MNELNEFIESGILELYVLGHTTVAQNEEVERMMAIYPHVRFEIEEISKALEAYARKKAIEPDPIIKPMLMATIDFMKRMESGEPVSFPPMLDEKSRVDDYAEWLNRDDLKPQTLKDIHVRIIGHSAESTLAIVWLKDGAPPEMHTNELETFLIVEGACDVYVDGTPQSLKAGDVWSIPLHKTHWVKVTSDIPCKVILQRKAA